MGGRGLRPSSFVNCANHVPREEVNWFSNQHDICRHTRTPPVAILAWSIILVLQSFIECVLIFVMNMCCVWLSGRRTWSWGFFSWGSNSFTALLVPKPGSLGGLGTSWRRGIGIVGTWRDVYAVTGLPCVLVVSVGMTWFDDGLLQGGCSFENRFAGVVPHLGPILGEVFFVSGEHPGFGRWREANAVFPTVSRRRCCQNGHLSTLPQHAYCAVHFQFTCHAHARPCFCHLLCTSLLSTILLRHWQASELHFWSSSPFLYITNTWY